MDSASPVVLDDARAVPLDRRRIPVELRIAFVFASIWACGLLLGLPLNSPDSASLEFVQKHYFSPLAVAFLVQIPIVWWAGKRNQADPLLLVKLAPFLALVILVHFNFKAWMPLVNSYSFDEAYYRVDQMCWPVVELFRLVRLGAAELSPVNLDHLYHELFVAMFFISFAVHAVWDTPRHQRQLVVGLSLVLLIGGLLYWVAPAVGPFLFEPGLNEESGRAQRHMVGLFSVVCEQGVLPPGYFTAPLAAMPSLHVAHALFFTLFAFRRVRWLFWLYLPALLWIVVESVASGWHYLIDLPVGAALAVYCLHLTRRLLPDRRQCDMTLSPTAPSFDLEPAATASAADRMPSPLAPG